MATIPAPNKRPRDRAARDDLAASAIGAIALAWLGFERLLPFSGPIAFWLVAYALFLVLYTLVSVANTDGLVARDRVAAVVFSTAGIGVVVLLGLVISFTAIRGWSALRHLNFFTETTATTSPEAALDHGGIYAAVIGTLEQVCIAMVLSVPLGLATAVYLNEVRGGFARVVRTIVETMTAVPTILSGLFIFAAVILTFGFNKSGLAVALALAVNMLPVVASIGEVVLRLVPGGLREASRALGASQWTTVRRVVLPTARPGLVTAVLLGVARVIGETAPVLICAGFTNELNYDPVHGPQVSLPLFTFTYVRYPIDNAIARAFASATVLLLLVLVLFTLARVVAGRSPGVRRAPRFAFARRSRAELEMEVA